MKLSILFIKHLFCEHKMNLFRHVLIVLICFISTAYAEVAPIPSSPVPSSNLPTLIIGIEHFEPPFVIQGAVNKIYGFDIDMINALCKIMNRSCRFQMMKFNELLSAVNTKKVDLAVSALIITAERSALVNFSLPYAVSYSRFLGNRQELKTQPFSLQLLNSKRIGLEEGTVFPQQLSEMGVTNPQIKTYLTNDELVEGLRAGEVDLIILDNPTAVYWEANSAGAFETLGPPYAYGFGYGIAVTPADPSLLGLVNQALLQYEASPEYKFTYNKYFGEF